MQMGMEGGFFQKLSDMKARGVGISVLSGGQCGLATNTKQACGCFRAVGFCEFGGDLDKVLAEILNDAPMDRHQRGLGTNRQDERRDAPIDVSGV
jgi:hypothetical protein